MTTLNNFMFLSDVDRAIESKVLFNQGGDVLAMQVNSDGTFSLVVQGQTNANAPFVDLFGVAVGGEMEEMSAIKNISANGIYTYDISGILKIKVKVNSISDGTVTAFGRTLMEV